MTVQYDKLEPALRALLPNDILDVLGRAVAFIQRLRAVRASAFIWSVVLSRFGSGRPGFEQGRHWYNRLTGYEFWPRHARATSPREILSRRRRCRQHPGAAR